MLAVGDLNESSLVERAEHGALGHGFSPMSPTGAVSRERIEGLAPKVLEVPVTLVTASGGFGKTTLLLAWMNRLRRDVKTAWVSMSVGDASVHGVGEALVLALRRTVPNIAGATRQLLAERNPDARRVGTTLGNELFVWSTETQASLVIVIDDAHIAAEDQALELLLSAFLAALPPRVHLILGSRSLPSFSPIGKLRIGHRIFELTEDDLRFRPDEAQGLVVDSDLAAEIVDRTDGWPIAVHFTASLVQERGVSVAQALPKASNAIFAFLAQEVFALLDRSARLQLALLALPTSLSGELVDFLFERSGGEEALIDFAARGLYLHRDRDGSWRMHDLFRAFLLMQLKRSYAHEEREMRRRLARWYRDHDDKLGALEQVIESGDLVEIVEYVHETLATIILTDKYRRLLISLSALPDTVKRQKPMLSRFYAIALQRADRIDEADAHLAICFRDATEIGDDATACMALIERGINVGYFRYRAQVDHVKSIELFRNALAISQRPALMPRRGYQKLASLVLGFALALSGTFSEAFVHLEVAEALEREENVHAELVFVEIGHAYGMLGDWRQALAYGEIAEEYLRHDAPYHVGYALMLQARARLALMDGLEQAQTLCKQAIELLTASFEENELGNAWLLYASVLLAEVNVDCTEVERAIAEAMATLHSGDIVARTEAELISAEYSIFTKRAVGARAALDRARRLLHLCEDRRLAAQVSFLEGRSEMIEGNRQDAFVHFLSARDAFLAISDSHRAAIAWFELVALGIQAGQPDEAAISALLAHLQQYPENRAARHAPDASVLVLLWALRNGRVQELPEAMFREIACSALSDLRNIAFDTTLLTDSRICAMHLLVTHKATDVHSILTALNRDSDQRVAATSNVLLGMLPKHTVNQLRIDVVGPVRLHGLHDVLSEGDTRFGRKKASELLRYLALAGGPVQKASVMNALWPDSQSGNDVTLRVTLHALRRALDIFENCGDEIVLFDGLSLSLQRSHIASIDSELAIEDMRTGKACASRGERDSAREYLDRAVERFLLSPKESAAPTWMQPHIVRWRGLALEALILSAQLLRIDQRRDDAMFALRRALELDPVHEPAINAMLELCIESGDVHTGREQFTHYRKRLMDAVGSVPGANVVERYTQLLSMASKVSQHSLSAREVEVLTLVASGRSSRQIASQLSLSEATINNHVGRILKKLELESRTAAVAYALAHGIIPHGRM